MTGPGSRNSAGEFSWRGRSVFITGATGFVGNWLAERFVRLGAQVTALQWPGDDESRPPGTSLPAEVRRVKGHVEDSAGMAGILRDAAADTVFHLAAININIGAAVSPLSVFETNTRGTWSMLEACRRTGSVARIVVASSREAEEAQAQGIAGPPHAGRRKRHPYEVSKIAAELVSRAYCDTYDVPVTISRSDNIYGGRDLNWSRLIPGTLKSLLTGIAPELRGDGTAIRDYVYVEDMVDAYLALGARAADSGVRGEVFHFATGVGTSVLDVVTQLCELSGRPDLAPVIRNDSKGERVNQERMTGRERDLLGWESRTSLREGLGQTVAWYRAYLAGTARTA